MEGGAQGTKGSFRGLLWGLCGGTDLNEAPIDKGPSGRAGSRAWRVGCSLRLLAPQRHLGAEHAPSKWWPRRGPLTQSLCPFLLFPPPPPASPLSLTPRPFPPHPYSFFLCLLFPVQRFSQRGPRGSGQNDLIGGESGTDHSPTSLAPPPPLTPLDGTEGSWIVTGMLTPRSEESPWCCGALGPGSHLCRPKAHEERDSHTSCPPGLGLLSPG